MATQNLDAVLMEQRPFVAYHAPMSKYYRRSTFSQQDEKLQETEDEKPHVDTSNTHRISHAPRHSKGFTQVSQNDSPSIHGDSTDAVRPKPIAKTQRVPIWALECFSCLIAILALIATVVVLHAFENEPLPNWPRLISINTVISILSAILKTAMLFPVAECLSELKWIWFAAPRPATDFDRFESASRGPWGSLLLLFQLPRNLLAVFGAIITIVALAIDPFTQQMIQYESCEVTIPGINATVQRASVYTAIGGMISSSASSLDSASTAALYVGLFSPPANATSNLAFSCISGNCTFSDPGTFSYRSLAICSSVQDISSSIIKKSLYSRDVPYNFTLPSGISVDDINVRLSVKPGTENTTSRADDLLFTFDMLMLNQGSAPDGSSSASAFRISFSPCIHEYVGANVSRGLLYETIRSTVPLPRIEDYIYTPTPSWSLAGDLPALPNVDCTPSIVNTSTKTLSTLPLPDGRRYLSGNSTIPSNATLQFYDPLCAYSYGAGPSKALSTQLFTFYGSQQSLTVGRNKVGPVAVTGPDWLLRLYRDGKADLASVSADMEGLANSLTAALRANGAPGGNDPATGSVLGTQTCVSVQWAWLALSAALLGGAFVFLAATAFRSYRAAKTGEDASGRPPWKSSLLPLLWCGFQDDTRRRHGVLNDVGAMERHGDGLMVRLARTGEWRAEGEEEGGRLGRWALKEE